MTTNQDQETMEPSLVGAVLGGAYRITRLIARGGMSVVYEAEQMRLHQRVAVKVMAHGLAANEEALARFQREAEVMARLRHPHLVTVIDFGTAPTREPYLVMEYLEGIDLDRRLRQRGPLPLPAVVSITRQAASALTAAHDQGIVHRDLKPANLFLLELAGEPHFVKVLDFGISKVRAATSQLTRASVVIGTPNYMSPEQATGMLDDISHRTDQWALACIVWEMLSGHAPFVGDELSSLFYQIIHLDPQPLARHAPDVPADVEAVLRRALAKSSADRFPSVMDFARALEQAAAGKPDVASAATAPVAAGPASKPATTTTPRTDEPTTDLDLDAAVQVTVARKLRPVYAMAAACVALMLVLVLRPRDQAAAPPTSASSPASMPPLAASAGPAMLSPAPPPTAPVVLPLPTTSPAPSSADDESKRGAVMGIDAGTAEATPRAARPKPTPRRNPGAGGSGDPFAGPFESSTAQPTDFSDPFAP